MSVPNQVNFLPEDYLARKARQRTNVICAFLFLVVGATIGLAFTVTERSTREVDREHGEVERLYADAAKRIEQVRQLNEKQRRMAQQAELTASLLEKVPRSFILAELTNSLPSGVSLLDFNMNSKARKMTVQQPKSAFEQKKAALASKRRGSKSKTDNDTLIPQAEAKVYDVSMRITGIASTDVQVAQLIRTLSQSSLLKDVNLVISDRFTRENETLRRFQIDAMLDPRASVESLQRETPVTTAAIELDGERD